MAGLSEVGVDKATDEVGLPETLDHRPFVICFVELVSTAVDQFQIDGEKVTRSLLVARFAYPLYQLCRLMASFSPLAMIFYFPDPFIQVPADEAHYSAQKYKDRPERHFLSICLNDKIDLVEVRPGGGIDSIPQRRAFGERIGAKEEPELAAIVVVFVLGNPFLLMLFGSAL